MCEQCRTPGFNPDVHIIDRNLEPEKYERFKQKGGRYAVVEHGFADPNTEDAFTYSKPRAGWYIPAAAWERIFGKKET